MVSNKFQVKQVVGIMYRGWEDSSVVKHTLSYMGGLEFKSQYQRENKELPLTKQTPSIGFRIFLEEGSRALSLLGHTLFSYLQLLVIYYSSDFGIKVLY